MSTVGANVSFGFEKHGADAEEVGSAAGDDAAQSDRGSSKTSPASRMRRHRKGQNLEGLGMGPGGVLARSLLQDEDEHNLHAGSWQSPRKDYPWKPGLPRKPVRVTELPSGLLAAAGKASPRVSDDTSPRPTHEGWEKEPPHLFLSLVLGAHGPPSKDELQHVREHRWTFPGVEAFAEQDRGLCGFVRCLLELQRAVQLEEAGPVLEPRLASACRTFVTGQCRAGREGHMYHLLSHFLSNSLIFHEWTRFLTDTFLHPRAGEEAFLVPRLELVWVRFGRLRDALEEIFNVLDLRFAWHHRLPKVDELIMDQMRRRCITPELLQKNQLFSPQAGHRADVVKALKNVAGI